MAARTGIARLIFFSGPQCSLCEVAKAELAKVKKQREFDLEVINIQEKGQERWKKKYIYWIPALHLDGKEIAKGRWDASMGSQAVDGIVGPDDHFIVDATPFIYPSAPYLGNCQFCLYDRIPGVALGEAADELCPPAALDLRLCFNCGSPDHAVASCPEPINRQLVSLSRQLFNFLHPDAVGRETTRFYIAEGWKQQRLEWLRSCEPGVIRGPLLRDALGLQEGDPGDAVEWLRNMAYWGYPPGWVGCRDPRQLVSSRILEDEVEGQISASEWDPFTIFEGADEDEKFDLTLFGPQGPSTPSSAASSLTTPDDIEPTRWAIYPNTYFSSTTLSAYSGTPLDRVAPLPSRVSVTFTPERRALWDRILSGGLGINVTPSAPPWRKPGTFGGLGCSAADAVAEDIAPPPPLTTPPPLPLTPNSVEAFPPQKCIVSSRVSTPLFIYEESVDASDDRLVVDMNISDDSE